MYGTNAHNVHSTRYDVNFIINCKKQPGWLLFVCSLTQYRLLDTIDRGDDMQNLKEDKSIESLNEVFASGFHEMQGFTNYVNYDFIKIHNKDYQYGCVSKLFTNESYELVAAHDLICSEKKRNDVSTYEQL